MCGQVEYFQDGGQDGVKAVAYGLSANVPWVEFPMNEGTIVSCTRWFVPCGLECIAVQGFSSFIEEGL